VSFDAGEIIAHLVLNRDQFNADLDKAVAEADAKTKDGIELKVKPTLDKTAQDEVLAEEEPLRADIEPEVKPTYAKAEAESVGRSIASDILSGAEAGGTGGSGGGASNLVSRLLAQGLNESEISSGLKNLGFSGSEIKTAIGAGLLSDINSGGGSTVGQDIAKAIMPTSGELDVALQDSVKGMGSGGGGGMFSGLLGSATSAWGGLSTAIQAAIPGSPVIAALGSALALAAGGVLGGTAIGGAGTLAALLPGVLDLMHGMAAYTAQTTPGASTKGMSASSLALGKQLQGLMGAGSSILGGLEKMVAPDITKFLNALIKAMPLMKEFAGPAVKAMGTFFSMIEQDMGSKKFAGMVKEMSQLVGPIMTQFGTTINNILQGLGPLVVVFGKLAASTIGPFFEKISAAFAKWALHVKISNPDIQLMKETFKSLGDILVPLLKLFVDLFIALTPIGVLMLRLADNILTPLIKGIDSLVRGVTKLVTWFMNLSVIKDVIQWFQKAGDGVGGLTHLVQNLGSGFKIVWDGIQSTVIRVWNIIKPILKAIGGAISTITGGIGNVAGIAGKIGGGIVGGISKGLSAVTFGLLASGGPATAGSPYIVGEQGPELFVPQTSGTVIPNGRFGAGGQHIYFQIDARGQSNPQQMVNAVRTGISATIPSLQAALARGAS